MPEPEKPSKVSTEGSARVLNQVKGRLEKVEAGELPTIERVLPDGSTRRVDHTGEMVRPDTSADQAAREAAEAFAAEHRATAAAPRSAPPRAASGPASPAPPPPSSVPQSDGRPGLWARIVGWFRRS